jgi:hypothetical protein
MSRDVQNPKIQADAGDFDGVAFPQRVRDSGYLLVRRAEYR